MGRDQYFRSSGCSSSMPSPSILGKDDEHNPDKERGGLQEGGLDWTPGARSQGEGGEVKENMNSRWKCWCCLFYIYN